MRFHEIIINLLVKRIKNEVEIGWSTKMPHVYVIEFQKTEINRRRHLFAALESLPSKRDLRIERLG